MENIIYDVVILGGGPAGMSVGSELAMMGHKVAVIEKNTIGETKRAWIVPGSIMNSLDEETQKYGYNGVKRFLEYTNNLSIVWDVAAPWRSPERWKCYSYIHQQEILTFWADRIKKNGSDIYERYAYIDSKSEKEYVEVRAVSQDKLGEFIKIKGRLILDATGYSSQMAKQNKVDKKDYFWWSVYGVEYQFDDISKLKHPGNLGEMRIGDYMLWQSFNDVPMENNETLSQLRPIMEYEIFDEKTLFVFILYYFNDKVDEDFMKNQFDYLLQNEESIKCFKESCKPVKERYGWYPSAGIKEQAVARDRIAFIGDAGCWTIPAGWGMSFILQNYRIFAHNINDNIKSDKLSAKELNKAVKFNTKEKYEILMDKLVLHFLSFAHPDLIDKFTKVVFDAYGGRMLEIMFCLKMTRKESFKTAMVVLKNFKLKELLSIFKDVKDYILVGEVIFWFFASWLVDAIRKLFGKRNEHAGFSFGKERVEE